MTTTADLTPRVSGVDALRAGAATAVFVCHLVAYWHLGRLPGHLTPLAQLGAHGVDVFVVVSGFCLALPVTRRLEHVDWGEYAIRRALRIAPPYYVALAFCAALAMTPATSHRVVRSTATLGDLLAHVVFLQTLVPGISGTINGSFWTVALEVGLYLLFPLVVLLWRRVGIAAVLVAAAVLSLTWEVAARVDWWEVGSNLLVPDRLVQFVAGAAAAVALARGRVPSRAVLWTGLVLGGVAAGLWSSADHAVGEAVIWALPSVCALLLACGRFTGTLGRPIEGLGRVSYSFYLLQQPVLLLTSQPAHRVTDSRVGLLLLGLTGCYALVIVLSNVLNRAVERPSIALGRRLVAARRARRSAASSSPTR